MEDNKAKFVNNYSNSKVYINPNFRQPPLMLVDSTRNASTYGNVTHINPNFNKNTPSHKSTKIFVNPNFFVSNNQPKHTAYSSQNNSIIKNDVMSTPIVTKVETTKIENKPHDTAKSTVNSIAIAHKPNSRYSFVRTGQARPGSSSIIPHSESVRCNTYKVNKYKLIPLNDAKKEINMKAKILEQRQKAEQLKNTLKLIKCNGHKLNSSQCIKTVSKQKMSHKKIMERYELKKIPIKAKLKKNNIPCSLFRKYGKCLRNTNGNCEYLHDRKHIALCRKFIKGICHDKNCLLSHDLSNKKMPTCYFYLKGMCTKDDCPYLHVKLNDKTKICPEFLKGYCDQGENCLKRHINISSELSMKDRCKVQRQFDHPTVKTKNNFRKIKVPVKNTLLKRKNVNEHKEDKKQSLDTRYYKDIKEGLSESEVVRPSRCKLGSLPSFIQL